MPAPSGAPPHPATTVVGLLLGTLALVGCGATDPAPDSSPATSPSSAPVEAPVTTAASATAATATAADTPDGDPVEGAVVRFSGGGTSVDVVLGPETPTTRDLVSLLPFTMQLEDLSGREKIGDPPRALDVEGTPGSDPEDGDLIYFTPWGNLGFYYDASGIDFSDATPHLGTYRASGEELSRFEGEEVRVELVG